MNSLVVTTTGRPLVQEQAAARAEGFTRDGWIFLALAAIITMLRTYSRWRMVGWTKFQADDVLVWIALGLYAGTTVIDVQLLGKYKGLANDFTDNSERATLSSDSEEYKLRVGASKIRLAEWPLYTLLLWSLKAAMAVFYMRLMESLIGYRRRIYIFFALMSTMFVIVVSMPFLVCRPINKMWQIIPDPGPLCYPESSPAILWTILVCNIITDAYLIWLPIPMLFHATLPKGTKIALGCLFGCGLFVTVAATLRITLVATQVHDYHAIGFWSVRETFVAIATTNLPAIFVLARRWFKSSLARAALQARKTSGSDGSGNGKSSTTQYRTVMSRVTSWQWWWSWWLRWSPPSSLSPSPSLPPPEHLGSKGADDDDDNDDNNHFCIPSECSKTPPHPDDGMKPPPRPPLAQTLSFRTTRAGSTVSASDKELMLCTIPSVQETLTNSRRRSRDDSVELVRPELLRRGSSQRRAARPATGGVRTQVDIMVVEEALQQLGAHPRRLDTFDDDERDDSDTRKLVQPSVPGAVHDWYQ